jgi:tRNA threonylcarbamoyl adenosine modification protein YeaZ
LGLGESPGLLPPEPGARLLPPAPGARSPPFRFSGRHLPGPAFNSGLDGLDSTGNTSRVKSLLAIAGCGPRLEVALACPASPAPALVALVGPTPRSDLIVAAIDLLLSGAGMSAADLEGVAASRGPGSFTGIRVALATALGIATAHAVIAHGYSSLLMQAARCETGDLLAVQPARRGLVYAQPYGWRSGGPEPLAEPVVCPVAELASRALPVVAPAGLQLPEDTPLATTLRSSAEALLLLLAREAQPDLASLVPAYFEPPSAQPPARRTAS